MRAMALIGALVLFPVAAMAQSPCTTDARRVVDGIYRNVLQRSADRSSGQFADRLASGNTTVREIVREVAKSPEHQQLFTRGDREQSVRELYRRLLGRDADPAGVQAHSAAAQSQGWSAVIDAFINSAEYDQKFGDQGVPGAAGLRYCGPGESAQSGNQADAVRFQAMDRNRDGAIQRGEWRGSAQSFRVHDWNRDGVLSGDELRRGGWQAANIGEEDFDRDDDRFVSWSEEGFANLDHNRDGRIARNEWHYDLETFRRVDRNGDGILARNEFLATDVDDDRGDRFEYLDVSRNGRVERNEWHGSADAFEWLDRNNDGVLNRTEVVGDERGARDRFSSLDVNDDSRLTFDEWHWSRRSFNQQDGNGDGVITRREFTGAVPTTGR